MPACRSAPARAMPRLLMKLIALILIKKKNCILSYCILCIIYTRKQGNAMEKNLLAIYTQALAIYYFSAGTSVDQLATIV